MFKTLSRALCTGRASTGKNPRLGQKFLRFMTNTRYDPDFKAETPETEASCAACYIATPSPRDRNDPSPSLPIRGGQLFPLPSTLQRRCVRALLDRFPTLKLEHSAGKSANKCYGRNGLLVLHGWGGVKLRRTCLAVRKFTDKFQVIANTVTRLWNIYQLTDSGILFSSSM